jgi:hypothetical protein
VGTISLEGIAVLIASELVSVVREICMLDIDLIGLIYITEPAQSTIPRCSAQSASSHRITPATT